MRAHDGHRAFKHIGGRTSGGILARLCWRQGRGGFNGKRWRSFALGLATLTLSFMVRLRSFLQVYAEFAARCPDHFSMIVAEARSDSDRFAWLQENYTGLLFEDVVDVLRVARTAGVIREVSLTDLSVMLIGGILVYFTFFPAPSKEQISRTMSGAFLDFIYEILAKGIAAKHK